MKFLGPNHFYNVGKDFTKFIMPVSDADIVSFGFNFEP